jgi:transcriptional regulator with XRE-family HTH domain
VNETLCRALIQAQLTEEDVATRLQVDPKTVRRWLEGRLPYQRHRWAIAAMLGADETDLWPQLRASRSRPDEVAAVYPHRDSVPRDLWLRVIGCAHHEIGILDSTALSPTSSQSIVAALAERAESGLRLRICLCDPKLPGVPRRALSPERSKSPTTNLPDTLAAYAPLRGNSQVEIRLHRGIMYSSIYYTDNELLIGQHAYGIPAGHAPVLHLRRIEGGRMVAAYLDAFERTWSDARYAD